MRNTRLFNAVYGSLVGGAIGDAMGGATEMMTYEHKGFWQPMDTHRDYQLLNNLYDTGRAPWVVWK